MDKLAKIEQGLDKNQASAIALNDTVNGIRFSNMGEVMEFAKLMSLSGSAVPKHLRGNPGASLAIVVQATSWAMEPFAVANKSYFVNDRIAFEAQLIQSVINARAPIRGRIRGEYSGEGVDRRLTVWAVLDVMGDDGEPERVDYTSPPISKIKVKNSPLWAADPDQQLWYYSARALCRRHFPDVIMGVYAADEITETMRDVTPTSFTERLAARNAPEATSIPGEVVQEPERPEAPPAPENGGVAVELEADPMSDDYTAGANCFGDGIAIEECPHEIGTQAAADWLGGWYGARAARNG